MRKVLLAGLTAFAMVFSIPTGVIATTVTPKTPFQTSTRPYLVGLQPGVDITPIISTGDLIGGSLGGFQYSADPDGIGFYQSSPHRLEVFTNHELSYRYGDPAWSRVSHLTLNGAAEVVAAGYVVDGTERYEYFCSSTMDMIGGVPWYFTGEEWFASPRGGMSIAINALTGHVIETPQFGSLNHENVVPMKDMSKAAMFLSEDSFRLRSQAYSYFADGFSDAIKGRGSFTVWVPDDQGDGDPSANDIAKGETMSGHFVTIPHVERYTGLQLNEVAESLGSFNFIRIEDAATDPGTPGVVYFADTGANKTTENRYGRIYKLTLDPAHPRQADLEVVLDSGAGDDIVNPDGLGLNDQALVIQEDRNKAATGVARIHVYDLASETLTAVAALDPSDAAIAKGGGPGVWESSGVVDVSDFFGPGMWLVNVQAHETKIRQQGLDLKVDSGVGERGQLLLVKIPGT